MSMSETRALRGPRYWCDSFWHGPLGHRKREAERCSGGVYRLWHRDGETEFLVFPSQGTRTQPFFPCNEEAWKKLPRNLQILATCKKSRLGILERNKDVLILVMSCACTVCCICFDILLWNENRSTKLQQKIGYNTNKCSYLNQSVVNQQNLLIYILIRLVVQLLYFFFFFFFLIVLIYLSIQW